jgi:predicted TIM-barrel fold metal-dependent hydrolase
MTIDRKIIDVHSYIGSCNVYDLEVTWNEICKSMDDNQISATILKPFPGSPDPIKTHTEIGKISKEFYKKIFGMVCISPHIKKKDYIKEIKRCVNELGFVGIFLHGTGHSVMPLFSDADLVFQFANELKVPIMVHTGEATTALPSVFMLKATEYPDLPIILTHAAFGYLADEHYVAAKLCPNIFLETSLSDSDHLMQIHCMD